MGFFQLFVDLVGNKQNGIMRTLAFSDNCFGAVASLACCRNVSLLPSGGCDC